LPQHHELGQPTHRVDSAVASGRSPAAQRQFRLPQRRRCTTPTRRSSPAPRPSLPEHGRAVLPQNLPVNTTRFCRGRAHRPAHTRSLGMKIIRPQSSQRHRQAPTRRARLRHLRRAALN
jgi:hypothetical protein